MDRLGPLGGDPAMAAPGDCDDRLGGAPANVACALARLGTPVAFIGRLGRDAIGDSFLELLNDRGVDLRGLQSDDQRPSRVVLVRRDASGERVFQGFAGDCGAGFADQALDQAALDPHWPALAERARWLLIGTIPLASAPSAAALRSLVAQAERDGVRVALDVNWRPTFWDEAADPSAGPSAAALNAIRPLLEQAALITLAREEALWFFSSDDPAVLQRSLSQEPDVVVTNGGQPARWCISGETGLQEVFQPPCVVDTTGAGDAFMAGLLHRWGASPVERIRFAAACGALVCSGAGAIDPQPTEAEVDGFIEAP